MERKIQEMVKKCVIIVLLLFVFKMELHAELVDYSEYTEISSPEDLLNINNNPSGKYVLVNDIDLTEVTKEGGLYDTGNGWNPLCNSTDQPFTGILDGNGHRIIGLHIYGDKDLVGLFSYAEGAKITSLGLVDIDFDIVEGYTGNRKDYYIAGLVAYTLGGRKNTIIEKCYISGNVDIEKEVTNHYTFFSSIANNNIRSTSFKESQKISNCYSTVKFNNLRTDILTRCDNIDGIGEYADHSYFAGKIVNNTKLPHIEPISLHCDSSSCYYLQDCTEDPSGNVIENDLAYGNRDFGGNALTNVLMKSKVAYTGFDFETVWDFDKYSDKYDYPQLRNNKQVRLLGMELIEKPSTTEYFQGTNIKLLGAQLKLLYENDYYTVITPTSEMCICDMSKIGEQYVSLSYGDILLDNAFTITIKEIPVSKVTIASTNNIKKIKKSDKLQLIANIEPENASNKDVTWSIISPKDVASYARITTAGVFSANKPGTYGISAKAHNGVESVFYVEVYVPVKELVIDDENITVMKDKTKEINLSLSPIDSTDKVIWESEDTGIATVSQSGTNAYVTGMHAGKTIIRATAGVGNEAVSIDCNVTVIQLIDSFLVSGIRDMDYTGSPVIQHNIVVRDDYNERLVKDLDYTITYKNNISPGMATVLISGIGCYEGTITKHFNIKKPFSSDDTDPDNKNIDSNEQKSIEQKNIELKKTKIGSIRNKKGKALIVKWQSVAGAKGYEVEVALNKTFTKKRVTKYSTKPSLSIKKLKKGKTYYIRVRAYNLLEKGKIYGAWSKRKMVRL